MEERAGDGAAETAARDGGRGGRAGRLRGVAIGLLLVAVAAAAVASVFISSALSHPDATAPRAQTRTLPVITLYTGGGSGAPATGTHVMPTPGSGPHGAPGQISAQDGPTAANELIVVSLSKQQLWAYQAGKPVFSTPVTTGQPALPTPTGMFTIMQTIADTTFYSPWPQGSPYYYTPEHINYAMLFADGGYFLHDASWRHCFGPGTNVPHTCPDGTQETGSHGCVNLPVPAAAWLFNWVQVGATVRIEG
jgi:lipoprotein-anchoring transpeptidase ErfK/SrfK